VKELSPESEEMQLINLLTFMSQEFYFCLLVHDSHAEFLLTFIISFLLLLLLLLLLPSFLGLLFGHEDGGSIFLGNVCKFIPAHGASY
jgi:hypothetical protein